MHSVTCQIFISLSTAAATTPAPGDFTKASESVPATAEFTTDQGNTCKQRELRAPREGETAGRVNTSPGEICLA